MAEQVQQEVQGNASVEARYTERTPDRTHFIDRADKCAKLTIPTLFIKETSAAKNMKIKDPAQSLGARGVNTLASKMILSLMPMNTPFFKLNIDDLILGEGGEIDEEMKTEVLKGLSVIERQTIREVENSGDVTAMYEVLKLLIVSGNALIYLGDKGTRVYNLNKYVVIRDADGKVKEVILAELMSRLQLPDNTQTALDNANVASKKSPEKNVTVYTHIKFTDERVDWEQTVDGIVVEGSESSVPAEGNPWLALRFMRVEGEDYGRSFVEAYLGDLTSLETLTKAVNDAAVASAKVLFLVNGNGTTSPQVLAKAPNMSVRTGNADDITILQLNKAADMSIARDMIVAIQQRLAYAFMINAEVLRDAERVTAEEVRFVAQELDSTLGGLYSLMSKEFQLPYVKRRMFLLRKKKNFPKLPPEVVPVIVTGFSALGRGHDREQLMQFFDGCDRILKNPAVTQYVNVDEAISRLAVSLGIETKGLQITADERKEAEQAAQNQQLTQTVAPELVKQAGPALAQQMQEGMPQNG